MHLQRFWLSWHRNVGRDNDLDNRDEYGYAVRKTERELPHSHGDKILDLSVFIKNALLGRRVFLLGDLAVRPLEAVATLWCS